MFQQKYYAPTSLFPWKCYSPILKGRADFFEEKNVLSLLGVLWNYNDSFDSVNFDRYRRIFLINSLITESSSLGFEIFLPIRFNHQISLRLSRFKQNMKEYRCKF